MTNLTPTNYKKIGILVVLFSFLFLLGQFIPEGFDWRHYFSQGRVHPIWTPWTIWIVRLLIPFGYPLVFALSALAIGIRAYRYNPKSPGKIALAFLSLPTLWVFFMGNLDGLTLLGLMILPWGLPLALMKPQVAAFALLAKRDSTLYAVGFVLLSFVIWGFWLRNLTMVLTPEWQTEWQQDIGLFPWGILLGLPLLWFSRGDEDLLMAAGSLITPHLFVYHFILLMPSLARMQWRWVLLTWFISWTPLLANWLGPQGWHLGNLMSLCFWFGIFLSNPRRQLPPFTSLFDATQPILPRLFNWAFPITHEQ